MTCQGMKSLTRALGHAIDICLVHSFVRMVHKDEHCVHGIRLQAPHRHFQRQPKTHRSHLILRRLHSEWHSKQGGTIHSRFREATDQCNLTLGGGDAFWEGKYRSGLPPRHQSLARLLSTSRTEVALGVYRCCCQRVRGTMDDEGSYKDAGTGPSPARDALWKAVKSTQSRVACPVRPERRRLLAMAPWSDWAVCGVVGN